MIPNWLKDKHILQLVNALNDLEKIYISTDRFGSCPLCRETIKIEIEISRKVEKGSFCRYCPWMFFKKQTCTDYTRIKYKSSSLPTVTTEEKPWHEEFINQRLKEIPEWKAKLLKSLKDC